jgi:hypothetical protein
MEVGEEGRFCQAGDQHEFFFFFFFFFFFQESRPARR